MGIDQHGRTLGRCTVGSTDINRQMVALGFATAYRRYSLDYVSAEQSAKAAKLGIWSGTFTLPSDYRRAEEHGASQMPVPAQRSRQATSSGVGSSSCVIKGNRGKNGWIYHLPGMPYYNQTRAEETFCTEEQARVAGYRRAKVR